MLATQTVLGEGGYKINVKIAKRLRKHMFFMRASMFVINYLNKNKLFDALSKLCHTFYTLCKVNNKIIIIIIKSFIWAK